MKNISGFVALAGLVMGSAFFSQAHAQTAWNTIASNAKVEIQESVQICNYDYSPMDNGEVVILRVRNKTNASVNVSFRMDVYYNDQCVTCGNDEYVFKATLPANGVITGSCQAENPQHSILMQLKSYTNRPDNLNYNRIEISQLTTN